MNGKQALAKFFTAFGKIGPDDDGAYDSDATIEAANLIPAVIAFLQTQPAHEYVTGLEAAGEISITVRIGRAEPVEYATKQDVIDAMEEINEAIKAAIEGRYTVIGYDTGVQSGFPFTAEDIKSVIAEQTRGLTDTRGI